MSLDEECQGSFWGRVSSVTFSVIINMPEGVLRALPLVLGVFRVTFFSFGTRAVRAKSQP